MGCDEGDGEQDAGALTGSKETTEGISTTLDTLIFLPSCSPSPLLAAQAMRLRKTKRTLGIAVSSLLCRAWLCLHSGSSQFLSIVSGSTDDSISSRRSIGDESSFKEQKRPTSLFLLTV